MTDFPPFPFVWDGEAMRPASQHWSTRADQVFTTGEKYTLVQHQDRSMSSHRHYFAAINEAWRNLPEDLSERFATPDHLRRWLLIKCGYRNERTFVCGSKAEALRMAAFMRPMDDYAVIVAREATVIAATAKSQSMKAMGKQAFQESKTAVLDECARLIGTSTEALKQNVRRAA